MADRLIGDAEPGLFICDAFIARLQEEHRQRLVVGSRAEDAPLDSGDEVASHCDVLRR